MGRFQNAGKLTGVAYKGVPVWINILSFNRYGHNIPFPAHRVLNDISDVDPQVEVYYNKTSVPRLNMPLSSHLRQYQ
jgi:hypothetical protein